MIPRCMCDPNLQTSRATGQSRPGDRSGHQQRAPLIGALDAEPAAAALDVYLKSPERGLRSYLAVDRLLPLLVGFVEFDDDPGTGAGLAMMEMMHRVKRDFGVRIRTVITGYAYSMGAILVQAGDCRVVGKYSTLMLHSGRWMIAGEDQRIFEDYRKHSDHYKQLIGSMFAERTGHRHAKWWIRYVYSGRDRFLSAQECLKLGLIDVVTEDEYSEAAGCTP